MKKNYTFPLLMLGCSLLWTNEKSNAQSPGGVAGSNTIWLKANMGTTLNANNNVTQWNEVSGAAVTGNFTTANGLPNQQPPLLQNAGLNFNPNIVFERTAPNSLISLNAFPGTSILNGYNNTLFQVIKLRAMTSTGVWLKWQFTNTSYYRLGNEVNNGGSNAGKMRFDFRNAGNNLFSNSVIAEKNMIATAFTSQASNTIRLNGATDATQSIPSAGQFLPGATPGRFSLGNEWTGDSYPTSVDIAEVILYSRTLTPAERNRVESYLAVKYGFTLTQIGADANDYTASNGTVTWDHIANATFLNNITGVGRDDSSALEQKQSLSINDRAMVTLYHGDSYGSFPAANADNTQTFAANLTYVLFGDNQADTLVKICSKDGRYARMARTWKTQVTGSTAAKVTLALQKAKVSPEITALIVASDANFTTNVQHIPIQDNGSQLYAAYAFSSQQPYFTFGTTIMELNGVVGPIVCEGNNGTVTLHPSGGSLPAGYAWNSTPAQTEQDLKGVVPGTYTVTVTQANGCVFSEDFTVIGNNSPLIVGVTDTQNTLCTINNGAINVNAHGGTPAYQFSLDDGPFDNPRKFTGLNAGPHVIKVKDQNNCEADTSVILTNYTYTLDVTDSAENAWCDAGGLGGSVRLNTLGGAPPYSYFWATLPTGKGTEMTNLPKGTYRVVVTDKNGCTGEITTVVEENYCCNIFIPNAFTPNNDGSNDKFEAIANRPIPKYEMSIFNRWGERLFYSTKTSDGWDGNSNSGKQADIGTYFYRIKYTCEMGKQEFFFQGDIMLIR